MCSISCNNHRTNEIVSANYPQWDLYLLIYLLMILWDLMKLFLLRFLFLYPIGYTVVETNISLLIYVIQQNKLQAKGFIHYSRHGEIGVLSIFIQMQLFVNLEIGELKFLDDENDNSN
ncbi:hypothetical protein ACTA71_004083 [Dictyostelium dimigraforme]